VSWSQESIERMFHDRIARVETYIKATQTPPAPCARTHAVVISDIHSVLVDGHFSMVKWAWHKFQRYNFCSPRLRRMGNFSYGRIKYASLKAREMVGAVFFMRSGTLFAAIYGGAEAAAPTRPVMPPIRSLTVRQFCRTVDHRESSMANLTTGKDEARVSATTRSDWFERAALSRESRNGFCNFK